MLALVPRVPDLGAILFVAVVPIVVVAALVLGWGAASRRVFLARCWLLLTTVALAAAAYVTIWLVPFYVRSLDFATMIWGIATLLWLVPSFVAGRDFAILVSALWTVAFIANDAVLVAVGNGRIALIAFVPLALATAAFMRSYKRLLPAGSGLAWTLMYWGPDVSDAHAVKFYQSAVLASSADANRLRAAIARWQLAMCLRATGKHQAAVTEMRDAIELFPRTRGDPWRMSGYSAIAFWACGDGELDDAEDAAVEALRIGRSCVHVRQEEARALLALAMCRAQRGEYSSSLHTVSRAAQLARRAKATGLIAAAADLTKHLNEVEGVD